MTSTEIPLVYVPGSGYGLDVTLHGYNNSLLLDTGASGIVVSRSVAQHAGILRITDSKMGGVGDKGTRKGFVGVVDSIKIGNLEFQDCPVEVIESRSVVGGSGLIGGDVFEDFLVDIDFPDQKLKLSQLPKRPGGVSQKPQLKSEGDSPDSNTAEAGDNASTELQDRYIAPEMQFYTRVFRFGHTLLIPTGIGDLPPKLFLLDSGSWDNVISLASAREVTKVRGSEMTVKGLSGNVNHVYSAKKVELRFGNLRFRDKDVTSLDTKKLSDDIGTEISGILGSWGTFGYLDIKIDYRDALVDFQYDDKHWDHSQDPKHW